MIEFDHTLETEYTRFPKIDGEILRSVISEIGNNPAEYAEEGLLDLIHSVPLYARRHNFGLHRNPNLVEVLSIEEIGVLNKDTHERSALVKTAAVTHGMLIEQAKIDSFMMSDCAAGMTGSLPIKYTVPFVERHVFDEVRNNVETTDHKKSPRKAIAKLLIQGYEYNREFFVGLLELERRFEGRIEPRQFSALGLVTLVRSARLHNNFDYEQEVEKQAKAIREANPEDFLD